MSFQASGTPPWGILAANTGNGAAPSPNGGWTNGTPQPNGSLPALTDAAIREFLSQPRGQLAISSLGNLVLVSPRTFAGRPLSCDARNGPFVRVNNIIAIPGERLWEIELTFETCVIENPTPSLIISNRWTTEANVNWQHLTTRTYTGVVTVRSDALLNAGAEGAGVPARPCRAGAGRRPRRSSST